MSRLHPPPAVVRPKITALLAIPLLLVSTAQATASAAAPSRSPAPGAVTLHADPDGKGRACSRRQPCDMDEAQRQVRRLAPRMTGDIVVELAAGTYRRTSPLTLTAADSGTGGHTVFWQAAPGARPVISGGQRIAGWRRAETGRNLWVARVPASLRTRQLYVDGQRAPVAQGVPPVALARAEGGFTAADASYAGWRNPKGIEFVFTGGNGAWTESRCRVERITGTGIAMQRPCWDNVTNRPKPAIQAPYYFPDMSPTTVPDRIENAFELLHEGQWYLDEARDRLYYWPPAGRNPNHAAVEAPVLETLVAGAGTLDAPVHDITLRGLQFSYATWLDPSGPDGFAEIQANIRLTGDQSERPQGTCELTDPPGTCPFGANAQQPANVTWRAAHDILIEDNLFTHLGAGGLTLAHGSQRNTVRGNEFTDISGIGVQLGSADAPNPTDPRAINLANRIENNYVHHTGAEYAGASGILLFFSRQTVVAHNEVAYVPWDGIDSGANAGHVNTADHPDVTTNVNADNQIVGNLVHDYHGVLSDGGAIYLEGHQGATIRNPDGSIDREASFRHGTMVAGNVVYNDLHSGLTLYNDIGSQWITWRDNVQFATGAGNGGCAPVGHIRFVHNHHSDPIAVYPCGPPAVDLEYADNIAMPMRPGPADLPAHIVAGAGLQSAYRHLATATAPEVSTVNPRKGIAAAPTEVLVVGSGFTPDTAVSWDGRPATQVRVLSPSFVLATAPAGAPLAEVTVQTRNGSHTGPSGLPLAEVVADSMDDEVFWRTSFDPYNIVDRNLNTFWSSAGTAMPHWIEIRFTRPVTLGRIVVHVRRLDQLAVRDLSVGTAVGDGPLTPRGTVTGNTAPDVTIPFGTPAAVDRIRITVESATYAGAPRDNADLAGISLYDADGRLLGN
ncbi:right-handed parallel beta-helix repeat-containing protein [Plantactinospora sp. WMMC1484]|uniref:right-handed parallel beta-helix repeat-containing protein n=1 Tax=Plantactinospora sp. WMMC1484 TaxID=3404122 RepID=UPI003BF611AB